MFSLQITRNKIEREKEVERNIALWHCEDAIRWFDKTHSQPFLCDVVKNLIAILTQKHLK